MTIALVTGAASGIGAAIARRIAAPGLKLMLHTRKNADGLAAVAAAAKAKGATVETMLADLALPTAPSAVIDAAKSEFGGLDWLIANAGFADRRLIGDLPADGVAASFNPITSSSSRATSASMASRCSNMRRPHSRTNMSEGRSPPRPARKTR